MTTPSPETQRKFPIWLILAIVGGLVLLLLCGGAVVVVGVLGALGQRVETTSVSTTSAETQLFVASDGQSQVRAPESWLDIPDLHDDAEIRIGDEQDEAYMIVLTEAREDLGEIPLDEYTDLVTGGFSETLENAEFSEARTLTINGLDAIQIDVSGTVDATNIAYTLTCVEGTDNFFQVISRTLASRAERNGTLLNSVITSFEELP